MNLKKTASLLLALCLLLSLAACGGTEGGEPENGGGLTAAPPVTLPGGTAAEVPGSAGKTVLNVMSFTDEVPNMIARYLELHPDLAEKYEMRTTIIATTDGLYQPALDQALATGGADAPDIYCAEAAFVLKYAQGDAAGFAAAYEDLGIDVATEMAEADIAPYSVEIGTRPDDGRIVGLGYQATGGAFIYRRSVALATWGDDDPDFVADKIGAGTQSWDKFFAAAEELREAGFGIVSGDGDIWHAVENSSDSGWIVDGRLNIDPKREAFLDLSMELMENGYHNDTQDWGEAWFADMQGVGDKEVLGFYGPAWLINYVMVGNSGYDPDSGEMGTYGDWAVCPPNVGFFWGGTWVLANKDTTKKDAVAEIIRWIALDATEDGLQYGWANGTWSGEQTSKDTVASGVVMAMSNGELDFLGGQDMFDVFVPANQYANGRNLTQYDETINTFWRDAVRGYTGGTLSRDEALAAFRQNVGDNLDVLVD